MEPQGQRSHGAINIQSLLAAGAVWLNLGPPRQPEDRGTEGLRPSDCRGGPRFSHTAPAARRDCIFVTIERHSLWGSPTSGTSRGSSEKTETTQQQRTDDFAIPHLEGQYSTTLTKRTNNLPLLRLSNTRSHKTKLTSPQLETNSHDLYVYLLFRLLHCTSPRTICNAEETLSIAPHSPKRSEQPRSTSTTVVEYCPICSTFQYK